MFAQRMSQMTGIQAQQASESQRLQFQTGSQFYDNMSRQQQMVLGGQISSASSQQEATLRGMLGTQEYQQRNMLGPAYSTDFTTLTQREYQAKEGEIKRMYDGAKKAFDGGEIDQNVFDQVTRNLTAKQYGLNQLRPTQSDAKRQLQEMTVKDEATGFDMIMTERGPILSPAYEEKNRINREQINAVKAEKNALIERNARMEETLIKAGYRHQIDPETGKYKVDPDTGNVLLFPPAAETLRSGV